MKSTGIVRKIDNLGRIVIPMELRRTMNIKNGDPIEMFTDSNGIILKKYGMHCEFCGEDELSELIKDGEKHICRKCIKKFAELEKKKMED